MKYTYYDDTTGEIFGTIDCPDPELAALHLADKTWITGEYNWTDYYVDQGQVVNKPIKPRDGFDYVFDWTTHTWQLDIEVTSQRVRAWRDQELARVDRVNPVWYNSMTAEQQAELAVLRQALLDVPQQSGFPTQVIWPAKPDWF